MFASTVVVAKLLDFEFRDQKLSIVEILDGKFTSDCVVLENLKIRVTSEQTNLLHLW